MSKHQIVTKQVLLDTSKMFILNLPHFIKYLFSWKILPILGFFSLIYLLFPISVLAYIFLNLIVLMMVYKFAFDVLADTARGNMTPNVRQNYLVTNAIAIKVAFIALIIEGSLMLLDKNGFDAQIKYYFVAFMAFVTPAIYMCLALTNSLFIALNPIKLFHVIKITHLSYFLFVGFWLSTISLHELLINPFIFERLPVFLNGVVSSFIEYAFLILNFQIMGYIVFQKRHEFDLPSLGFETIVNDSVVIEKIVVNPIYQRINMLLSDDQADLALAMISELQKEGDHSSELQELYKKAMERKLYTPTNMDVATKVHRWLLNNEISRAFKMVISHLDDGKDFVEESPDDINWLIKYAMQSNKTIYIPILLKDFHIKYPYHADIVPNYFILAKLLYENRDTRDKSKDMLKNLIEKYPLDAHMSEIKSWYKGVKLMSEKIT